MSRLHMVFDPPFKRSAIKKALQPLVGTSLPEEATVKLSVLSRDDDLSATPRSSDDRVSGLEIGGINTIDELVTFLQALPDAVDEGTKRLDYRS